MNKRAFTLIELMIVIAILGILMSGIYKSFAALSDESKYNRRLIDETTSLTVAYAAIKSELGKCTEIIDCDFDRVLFNDDHGIKIARNGKTVTVGNKEIKLIGNARIRDLIALDSRSFSTEVATGRDKITVIWRTGGENGKQ